MDWLQNTHNIPALQTPDSTWQEMASQLHGADAKFLTLIEHAWHYSPYLRSLITKYPDILDSLQKHGPEQSLQNLQEKWRTDTKNPIQDLRIAKAQTALILALCDIAGAYSLDRITKTLSDFADLALQISLAHNLQILVQDRQIAANCPVEDCGIFILSLGKHGGQELNYSSDIDIIIFFDMERMCPKRPDHIATSMMKFARNFIATMEQRTKDGYVFRMDPRLRPDPTSSPLAINVRMAEHYYETVGRNWERAAFIKARFVAGDAYAAQAFLHHIRPFIWRRSLDYAGLDEIHSMTAQLHSHHDKANNVQNCELPGLNLKWASGCIRQIEIFCQQHQLLWGGRSPDLRTKGSIPTLQALAEAGIIDTQACDTLLSAYRRYRTIEHRLQMINDQQTQKIPQATDDVAHFAKFLLCDQHSLKDEISTLREIVINICGKFANRAITDNDDAFDAIAATVLASAAVSPTILQVMEEAGFHDSHRGAKDLHHLIHGDYRAVRSKRGRELLGKLIPDLLRALTQTPNANDALHAFVTFVQQLPVGIQLFALLEAQRDLLHLLVTILTDAPAVGEHLIRKPSLLENLITQPNLTQEDNPTMITAALVGDTKRGIDLQDCIDITTNDVNDWMLVINAQLLQTMITMSQASRLYSALADQAIASLVAATAWDYKPDTAEIGLKGLGIIAFGRLGSETMLFGSDLDLVFIYDDAHEGLGDCGQYFQRLFQRIARNIGMPNAAGRLYELDSRLRPTSTKSSLATSFTRFREYYEGSEKWTWERMALLQTRVVYGTDSMKSRIEALIKTLITQKTDYLQEDIIAMRARWSDHHKPRNALDLKYIPGGLMDLAYIREYLALSHFHDHHADPLPAYTDIFAWCITHNYMTQADGHILQETYRFYQDILGAVRLTNATHQNNVANIAQSQQRVICAIARQTNMQGLLQNLQAKQEHVIKIANEIIPGLIAHA
ncbi:MAG: bifunctional [glutamate--ammonia ligase]-adenylyl-L-tyrosine phosphorylase/[glutamate--ammonia-ligase] adenylyltransferase [Pseudomonadota bacterium]